MNRFIPHAASVLVIMTSACTFDLTEVRPEARDARVVVLIETARDRETRVSIYVDPGTTEEGVPRTLAQEDVLLDGVAYPPVEHVEERRQYEVLVPESTTSIHIVLPSISGMAEVPAIVAVPLRVTVPDTVLDNDAGFLEIPVFGGRDDFASSSHWNASLYTADATAPRLTVSGTNPIPSVLRVPTTHLSDDVQGGKVTVTGATVRTLSSETALAIMLQRTMYASVPFSVLR